MTESVTSNVSVMMRVDDHVLWRWYGMCKGGIFAGTTFEVKSAVTDVAPWMLGGTAKVLGH